MSTPQFQVRRATVDDLAKLAPLWRQENLPVDDLEKRFKEFQVVEGPGGELLGALGLRLADQEGLLHSEVFAHPEQADLLRQQLWDRAQVLVKNHGLARVWTQLASPFWHTNGFSAAGGEMLAKLPAAFSANPGPWIFLKLREESAAPVSLDKEFALFKEAERERTERMYQQARVLKMVAYVLAGAVLLLVVFGAFYFIRLRGMGR